MIIKFHQANKTHESILKHPAGKMNPPLIGLLTEIHRFFTICCSMKWKVKRCSVKWSKLLPWSHTELLTQVAKEVIHSFLFQTIIMARMMNMVDISASAKVNFTNLKDQYSFQMSMIHMIVYWTRQDSERREKKVAASSNAISNSIHLPPLLKVIWSAIDIFLINQCKVYLSRVPCINISMQSFKAFRCHVFW